MEISEASKARPNLKASWSMLSNKLKQKILLEALIDSSYMDAPAVAPRVMRNNAIRLARIDRTTSSCLLWVFEQVGDFLEWRRDEVHDEWKRLSADYNKIPLNARWRINPAMRHDCTALKVQAEEMKKVVTSWERIMRALKVQVAYSERCQRLAELDAAGT